jgi:hypothetical protein
MATAMAMAMERTNKNDHLDRVFGMKVGVRFLTVAAITLTIAYFSFSAAFVRVVASANPQAARTLQPKDPLALAASADASVMGGLTAQNSREFRKLTVASLSAQALNPRALRLLATVPEPAMSDITRERLLTLSHRLSRRDFGTQLLLIEKNAQTDDVAQTLKHYNYALTTERNSWDTLFPILAAAIEDQSINREFSNLLPTAQPWMDAFVRFKLEKDAQSNALVSAANAARIKPSTASFNEMKQYLFERSVRTGNFSAARQFYQKFSVSDPGRLQSADFFPAPSTRQDAVVRWRLFELPYILPQLEKENSSSPYQLTVQSSSSARGTVATKLLMLQPGAYRLGIVYGDVKFTPSTFATWMLRCLAIKGEPVIWTATSSDAKLVQADIVIPATCEAQTLELLMAAGPAQEDSTLIVKSVNITKLN